MLPYSRYFVPPYSRLLLPLCNMQHATRSMRHPYSRRSVPALCSDNLPRARRRRRCGATRGSSGRGRAPVHVPAGSNEPRGSWQRERCDGDADRMRRRVRTRAHARAQEPTANTRAQAPHTPQAGRQAGRRAGRFPPAPHTCSRTRAHTQVRRVRVDGWQWRVVVDVPRVSRSTHSDAHKRNARTNARAGSGRRAAASTCCWQSGTTTCGVAMTRMVQHCVVATVFHRAALHRAPRGGNVDGTVRVWAHPAGSASPSMPPAWVPIALIASPDRVRVRARPSVGLRARVSTLCARAARARALRARLRFLVSTSVGVCVGG
jgi:hypothetical protein